MRAHGNPPEHAPVHTGTRPPTCPRLCQAWGRRWHAGSVRADPACPLPWSKPVRMREKVMKARWALPRWASSGVAAVMKPQAEADSRMTFSPPILHSDGRAATGSCAARRHPSLGAALWGGGRCSQLSPPAPELPPWKPGAP